MVEKSFVSRRILASQAPSAAPMPALAPVPAPASASSPSPGPQAVPRIIVDAPSPSYHPPFTSPPSYDPFPVPSPVISHGFRESSPEKSPLMYSNIQDHNNNNRTVVISVVLTAAVTTLLVAFLFCCYQKCCRKRKEGHWQRVERPLLSLSLSDFSGSSNKSFMFANSMSPDKRGSLSFIPNGAQVGHFVSFNNNAESNVSTGVALGTFASALELSNSSVGSPNAPSIAVAPPPLPPPPPVMPQFKKTVAPSPVPPPPVTAIVPNSQPPPPPPKGGVPPKAPPTGPTSLRSRPSPLGPGLKGDLKGDPDAPKTKLKPLFWDKVLAKPDESMVWNQIKCGSFQFNEEMIENLFGYGSADKKGDSKKPFASNIPSTQYIHILEPKKSQNLAIFVKALNVKTEEVCDALMEGNELPKELLHVLLRMAPTADEELKLRLYCGEIAQLGPSEQFLKSLVDIPFAFKRIDALLFMFSLQEDVAEVRDSFSTLEVACKELGSRLFLKLLEAVLKTGNRMNDGTLRGGAHAFKLDTLLKLSDVKGKDGKTTLLHFVVQEIIRSEGRRAARVKRQSGSISALTTSSHNSVDLSDDPPQETEDYYHDLGLQVVSGLSYELENVKKAASLDSDALTNTVANLGHKLVKTKEFLITDMRKLEEESGFYHSLKSFVDHAESVITLLLEEEKRIRSMVKHTTDKFHGNAGKDEGLRLFIIVRDFLGILDKACKEVRESAGKVQRTQKERDNSTSVPSSVPRNRIFQTIRDRRLDSSSSDEEDP